MFQLTDFYQKILKKPLPTGCGITCELVNPEIAKLNRFLTESVSCFSYTLVTEGSALVHYDDKITRLAKNDFLIYSPGMMIITVEASDDYRAICLIGDEKTTYEIPYARNLIRASYNHIGTDNDKKLTLTDSDAELMAGRMMEIRSLINSDHIYKTECLYSLYSLFILDLLNIERRFREDRKTQSHAADLFFKFLQLATENFTTHHDINFYADALAITTIYLSRIVKSFSRQTVKNHLDRLLVMEASYLLLSTDLPVSAIAERLHFANPSSFCKFFTRHKLVSPREYRNSCSYNL